MAALIDAISIKRKMFFEYENTPFYCLEAEVSTPTARGAQTLVRLKMRNLLTRAVFEKSFKASELTRTHQGKIPVHPCSLTSLRCCKAMQKATQQGVQQNQSATRNEGAGRNNE